VIYSVLISCRRHGLNPQEYLADVLGRLPSAKITQIQELLPPLETPIGEHRLKRGSGCGLTAGVSPVPAASLSEASSAK
jgi:hypothetical protein